MVSKQYGVCVCVCLHTLLDIKTLKKQKHFSSRMLRGKHKKKYQTNAHDRHHLPANKRYIHILINCFGIPQKVFTY